MDIFNLDLDYNKIVLPKKAFELIHQKKTKINCDKDFNYDLVYILKEDDYNPDLVMSLRSVETFCNYRKIWVIGYKPKWLQNVEYIPTVQTGNKWENSVTNWIAACKCKDISNDFILMNDDFFALKPIYDYERALNICLGPFDKEANKYKNTKFSKWQGGFVFGSELLTELGCETRFNYEAHTPIIINKKKFLKMLTLEPIKNYMQTKKVLHKRSMYKNLYPDNMQPRVIRDIKIRLHCDLLSIWLNEDWLSVFDNVLGNAEMYPKANYFLENMFPNKSQYEK